MGERHTGEWTDTMVDRILNRMKVTAIIPDALVTDVQRLARRKNLTESIVFALRRSSGILQPARAGVVRVAGRLPPAKRPPKMTI